MENKLIDILSVRGTSTHKEIDWDDAVEKCSFDFPSDYKYFVEKLGSGCVNDFLWILSPFANNENINTIFQMEQMKKAHMIMKMNFPKDITYPFYDGKMGLFPWGISDDGDGYFWYKTDDDIKIVVAADNWMETYIFDLSFSEFMHDILKGKIDYELLPVDFVRRKPRFKKEG